MGDSAYADGATLDALETQGYEVVPKVPPARNGTGGFTKDLFGIDLEDSTVTCPAAHTVAIIFGARGGKASFPAHCAACPLRVDCTSSAKGRSITIHPYEAALQRAKAAQRSEEWRTRYRTDRPVVERKIAHFTRRAWGGRKARTRGLERIRTDITTPAGVLNWVRLAVLVDRDGLGHRLTGGGGERVFVLYTDTDQRRAARADPWVAMRRRRLGVRFQIPGGHRHSDP